MTHPNDNELKQSDKAKQAIPQSRLYSILKKYVVGTDELNADKVNVIGFKCLTSGDIQVYCELNGNPYDRPMPSDNVRHELEQFMQKHFVAASIDVLKWGLRDKDNPYLLLDYVINAVGDAD